MGRKGFPRYAWGVFAYSLLVILWGYFLRISRSGDGCGTDWPLCHGAVVPAASFPTMVEYIHRVSSGLVLLLVLAMAVWAFRSYPRGSLVRWAAAFTLLFTITESLFGAVLVIFGWVAEDASLARILIRPFHVTNTFLLMGALALTPWWASRCEPRSLHLPQGDRNLLLAGLATILVLGWTGSWTGLANAAFPAETLRGGLAQYMDPEHLLIYLRMAHPALAVPGLLLLGWLGLRLRERGTATRRLGLGIAGSAAAQLAVGPLAILLPEGVGVRLLHLFLADLTWIFLLLAGASLMGHRIPASSALRRPSRLDATPKA